MRITDKYVPSIRYVNSIRKVRDVLAPNPPHKNTILSEHHHIVALEVTDIELPSPHGNITWFPHVVSAVNPAQQLPLLGDHKHGGGDGVDSNNIPIPGDCQPGHNVNVPYGNLPDEVAMLGEDLHPAPLIPSVTDHKLA